MRTFCTKPAIVFLLICSIWIYSVVPLAAKDVPTKPRVAYLGLDLKNIPKEIREVVLWRMNAILDSADGYILTNPDDARSQFGQEIVDDLVVLQQHESFLAFGAQNGFDFVFSGALTNESADEEEIFLSGELNRYDVASGQSNRYLINNSFAEFGNELVRFKNKHVKSISTVQRSGFNPLNIVLAGGVTIAAILLLRAGFKGGTGEDQATTPTDE